MTITLRQFLEFDSFISIVRPKTLSFLLILSITDKQLAIWQRYGSRSTFPLICILLYKRTNESRDPPSFNSDRLKCVLDNCDLETSDDYRLVDPLLPSILLLHIQLPSARDILRPFLTRLLATLLRCRPSHLRHAKEIRLSDDNQTLSPASEDFLSHFLQVLEAHARMTGACAVCRLPTFEINDEARKRRLQSPSLISVRPPSPSSSLPDRFFAFNLWPEWKEDVGVKKMVAFSSSSLFPPIVFPSMKREHIDESSSYI
jgi:hypothetical protein